MKTISRYIMTLALLLTAVTGAWADGISVTTEDFGKVICTDGSIYATEGEATAASKTAAAKIFFIDNVNKKGLALALADESGAMDWSTAKTTAAAHTPAVTGGTWKLATMDEWTNMREAAKNYQNDEHNGHSTFKNMANLTQRYWVNTEDEYDSNNAYCYIPYSGSQFGFSTDPKTINSSCYVRACLEFNIASAAPEVKWDAATKTATFTMPGSDVVLTPQYAPVAKWDVVETVEQLPTALEGIIAGQDAAIVTAGQSAQGTVMYAVTTAAEPAPALTAFSATVPTAENYDDAATVYVWYYIQGHDTPDGQQATEENTFNDSEICATPLKVDILTNKFDLTLKPAPVKNMTVTVAGQAKTPTDQGKVEAVKMESEVKLKANTGYKFRKVEVKKKAAAPTTITVTWNGADITGTGGGKSFTKDGVTITAGDIEFMDKNFLNGGTFTTTLGNFTKIEVTTDGWYASGTGWSGSTWTGNASSVSFSGEIMGYGGDNLKFVFTIEPTN